MDWELAIRKNRQALAMIIAGLVDLVAMVDGAGMLPRPLHRFICRVLRSAESALRRLIVIVAALHRKAEAAETGAAAKRVLPDFSTFARGQNRASFALIDPRKSFGGSAQPFRTPPPQHALPQISVPGLTNRVQPERPDERLQAANICRRIEKLQKALKTLPRQARRLNRLMAGAKKPNPGPDGSGRSVPATRRDTDDARATRSMICCRNVTGWRVRFARHNFF